MINDIYNNQAVDITAGLPTPGNPRMMQPNAISPKAFSNQGAIQGMFGQANPGTFTRSVGNSPLAQITSQGYVAPVDPTNPGDNMPVDSILAQAGQTSPVMPPAGVAQSIVPPYDLSNQQL